MAENSLIKSLAKQLYQPQNEEVWIDSYFKSDTQAQLIDSKYNQLKKDVFFGNDFEYKLSHSDNEQSATLFDEYDNEISESVGWYITFLSQINGSIPEKLKVLDSDSDTAVGGETVEGYYKTVTPPAYYRDVILSGWNASAYSIESKKIPFDVRFRVSIHSQGVICGVNDNSANSSDYLDINYGFYTFGNQFKIIENGVEKSVAEVFATADIFKIKLFNDKVEYYLNDSLKLTSIRNENSLDFRLDVSLYSSGDEVFDAEINNIIMPAVGEIISNSIIGGVSNDLVNTAFGSVVSKDKISGYGAEIPAIGSIVSKSLIGGMSHDLIDTMFGAVASKTIIVGQESLLKPASIAKGAVVSKSRISGFIDSGECTCVLVEKTPIFNQQGAQIDKGVVSSTLHKVTFKKDGLDDIVIPVSSISGSLSVSMTSSMLLSIPNGEKYSSILSSFLDGFFVITTTDIYSSGIQDSVDSDPYKMQAPSSFQGARSFSLTVRGTNKISRIGGNTVKIYKQQTSSVSSGKRRLRCSYNKDLLPSDTVTPEFGSKFVVGRITIINNSSGFFMDVVEV